ncbi:LLM class flavin-dependent oxidoreductase [Ornithinimicrobium humiphilum]|uniref:Luciferase family oxidoreductase group 1 n=1 Tax=Ornithinimicrobium humiphilum TaxID=125288 RepID=A0A543KMP5_9MICO|nr:LLM class flavin-dependent oxidoreductase [Ornithinimicrobium humiphilum]TQM96352.1 luciferase family oxidoreductase group 1 [Ornithinimicrobium humiphilum]
MTSAPLALSVLDLVPVRTGQTTGQALTASRTLAQQADEAGVRRYWVAEHHNGRSVASTSPPVIIAMLAAATRRIRVGSGGVMLPNHAALAVAEQFALLEAAHPGRIDLGIGRAPGTDPVTAWALRGGATDQEVVQHFPDYVQQVMAFMAPEGAAVQIGPRQHPVVATPAAVAAPPVWLLGSSDYSARLAGQLGLPYVFAHHFSGHGTAEALELYRSTFAGPGEPRTFLTVNAVVADSEEEARRLALPFQHMMASLRAPGPMRQRPILTVEQALEEPLPIPEPDFAAVTRPWLLGTADEVADGVRDLAATFDVDEVMVQPIGGSWADEALDRGLSRERTVTELSARLVAQPVG